MILKGSQRGGPKALARHLMNSVENDHVELHQVHGLASESLMDALLEIDASKGASRSNKPFYHLSLNPPEEGSPSIADFESAISAAENRLGLDGQPHVVVFHEKQGRRHAHVVWSRVDEDGRLKRISFDKRHLQRLSAQLYQQHGWHMPIGLEEGGKALSTNYRLDEWMQSKRTGISPEEHKRLIGEAYRQSDGVTAFAQALKQQGYVLAQGRRGYVAVSLDGEVHSVMRAVGKRKKEVEAWLGKPADAGLSAVEDVQEQVKEEYAASMKQEVEQLKVAHAREMKPYGHELQALRKKQRAQRELLKGWQQQKFEQLETRLASRHRRGIMGLWDRLIGSHRRTEEQNRREREDAEARARAEKEEMIRKQITQRRGLKSGMRRLLHRHQKEMSAYRRGHPEELKPQKQKRTRRRGYGRGRSHSRDQEAGLDL